MPEIRRLTSADLPTARALFLLMAQVFEEPSTPLGDDYLARLLARPDFWALAALDAGEPVGGLTAHALPMTRHEGTELFIYDIAIRPDRQRQGIGRQLMEALRDAARTAGIGTLFVPADTDDGDALEFYRALGGEETPVRFFTFEETNEA